MEDLTEVGVVHKALSTEFKVKEIDRKRHTYLIDKRVRLSTGKVVVQELHLFENDVRSLMLISPKNVLATNLQGEYSVQFPHTRIDFGIAIVGEEWRLKKKHMGQGYEREGRSLVTLFTEMVDEMVSVNSGGARFEIFNKIMEKVTPNLDHTAKRGNPDRSAS